METEVHEYDFPALYHENYLVLLVRDPHCLYAYWELTPELMGAIKCQFTGNLAQAPITLRVYDLTGLGSNSRNPHGYFDISLHSMADNYFINEVDTNRSYCVELGVLTDEGDFMVLLRSNTVQTPRDSMADGSEPYSVGFFGADRDKRDDVMIGSFASHGIYGSSAD